ncbi:IWS1-like protein isoform X2 [Haliotis rubra]|uniref:IWS1-like protein isoform X2 n=1 Tax=Haliotis rubra TaxID=36100 RepID=UPI001EE50A3C|nr:IWS1-like protein isoform X2 [Haliotis rubra]
MDSDEPGSGGSTPLQDEPDYEAENGEGEEDGAPRTPGGESDRGPQSVEAGEEGDGSDNEQPVTQADDGDYFSDGGEVEREEVQRDVDDDDDVEREEVEREVEDDQEYQPGSDNEDARPGSGSPPGSPASGSIASPPASPMSIASGPRSPPGSGPQSPVGSPPGSPGSPMSMDGSGSRPGSPIGSGPQSPAGSGPRSPPSGPASPAGSGSPRSPGSGPASPAGSGPQSPAGSGSPRSPGSGPQSPAGSGPQSPSGSGPASPAGSGPLSPAGSGPQSPGSGPASPTENRPGSPTGSGPGFPAGLQPPASPMFSAPNSPMGSPMAPGLESFLQEEALPRSPVSDRSRSPSPGRSRAPGGSPSYSPMGSPRSTSQSPPGSPRGSPPSPGPGSDKENDGASDQGSGDERRPKARRIISDDESDREPEPEERKKAKASDDEDSDKESVADGLIADIFGSSDEDEEFEGFGEADVEAHAKKKEKKKAAVKSDDEDGGASEAAGQTGALPELSDDENEDNLQKDNFVSDFDLMIERKKEERQRQRRKRKDCDMINDNDDLIADMIGKMKLAAEEDRELNKKRQPATKKLKLLPWVISQLKKADLHIIFLDSGILSAITEWLAPLPDKSLPHLTIRDCLLKILWDFPAISSDSLKMSGIGKAVMYLYKHPKEIRPNKEKAGKLINEWSRPIFNLTSNYKTLSRDEREQRDYEQLPKRRKLSMEGSQTPRRDIDNAMEGEKKALRPGDPGWVYRARVPTPSNRDYVVRPKTEIEYSAKKSTGKKDPSRYDKHARAFADKKKHNKAQRAITISIEGRNMAL